MLEFTDEQFNSVRRMAEERYRSFGEVHCPYFQGFVHFNTDGFSHLLFKNWNRSRDRQDQFMRLKHLNRAPEVVRFSRTVQGILRQTEWERRKRHGRWERVPMLVTYYEFVAVLNDRRFKVVVKQREDGQRIFWSLIPFWRQAKPGTRLMHDGDPIQD